MDFISGSLLWVLIEDGNLRYPISESLPLIFESSDMMETEYFSTRVTNIWWNGIDFLVKDQRRNKKIEVWGRKTSSHNINNKHTTPTSTTHNTGDSLYEISKYFSWSSGWYIQSVQPPKAVRLLLLGLALKVHLGSVYGTGWWAHIHHEIVLGEVIGEVINRIKTVFFWLKQYIFDRTKSFLTFKWFCTTVNTYSNFWFMFFLQKFGQ